LNNHNDKSWHHAIQVKWPITIQKGQAIIEGETRIVTKAGLFIYCEEWLPKDDIYEMIVTPPNHRSVSAKGKLTWSNLDIAMGKGIFSGVGFYFAKITDEDCHLLGDVISTHTKPKVTENSIKPDSDFPH